MTDGHVNRSGSQKWAIAFYLYLLLLLAIAIVVRLNLVPTPFAAVSAHSMLAHFILLGIASYLSYRGLQQRTVWLWQCQIPVGPLGVALLLGLYQVIQIIWFNYAAGVADLAAGLSGIVLFYRLARANS
ncbi:MAG TPA: hypothetical protein V6C78_05015 [Crinalium sp.]